VEVVCARLSRVITRRTAVLCLAVVALVAGGCEQFITPGGAGPLRYRDLIFANVTKTSAITYGTAVTQQGTTLTLQLDVYRPTGDAVTARPLVVFVHGGGFSGGSRNSGEIVDEATTLARRGYVTASISYRLTPGGCSASVPTAECVTAILHAKEDAQMAVAFLRSHASTYGIDPGRIAIGGTSAGAITAANVAFSSTDSAASAVRAAVSLSGAHILTTPNTGDAPLLLLHGTADFVVPYAWAQNTVTAATDAGVRAVLTSWAGDGHVPYTAHRTEILEQTRNFLWVHLDLAHAAR
jgi:acetyl esterase/lipase